jgi:hypothetical protein
MNILALVKKELIGQPIRICTQSKSITSPVLVRKKKHGCTDKQWKENPDKFSTYVSRTRHLGFHRIFENTTIIDVYIGKDAYIDGIGESLIAITQSGHKVYLPFNESNEILLATHF